MSGSDMLVKDKTNVKCFHCGESCNKDHIVFDDKDFCCQGCKTVYEILNQNDLCEYYTYEKHPGNNKSIDIDKFLFLENEEIAHRLHDFISPELNKVTFYIPKIHCSSCIWLLENLNRLNPHILSSRVNFVKKTVSIDYNPGSIKLKAIAGLLAEIGYEPYISLDDEQKKEKKDQHKSLYIKIGVAGFCFGNIMLLSFPDYLGVDFLQDRHLKPFFSVLNILLALPVMFYAGSDYLISAYRSIRQKYINIDVPLALGIIALFGRSIYEITYQLGPGYLDSLAGLIFFLLTGKWFQSKTYDSLSFERDYRAYFPLAILKESLDEILITPVANLKKDDVIVIRNQEVIPCDGELLSDVAHLDYSFVTGESKIVNLHKGDHIYAGGRQTGAKIRIKVTKEVSQSYLTQLWNNESFNNDKQLKSQAILNKVSKYFTIVILLIAIFAFLFWAKEDIRIAINAFTAVLIIACPCALAMSVPFTNGNVTRVLGRNKFYLKNTEAVERLNHVDHLVFDKTGTLTQIGQSKMTYQGQVDHELLSAISALAFNSTHPLSKKIYEHLLHEKIDGKNLTIQNFLEIPGKGIQGNVSSGFFKIGSKSFVVAGSAPIEDEKWVGQSKIYVSSNNKISGTFQILDNYREGLQGAIAELNEHYSISLLSGDNDQERENLRAIFPESAELLFNQKPSDKLEYIKKLQTEGHRVLMAGDGLNDAGALQQSDIGIAVAEDTSSFSPASDAILSAGEITRMPLFLQFARSAKTILLTSFTISFLYNIIGLSFAVTGMLTPIFAAILMPISSISVVAFTTFAVNIVARKMKLI